jgi:hypothetical protein
MLGWSFLSAFLVAYSPQALRLPDQELVSGTVRKKEQAENDVP